MTRIFFPVVFTVDVLDRLMLRSVCVCVCVMLCVVQIHEKATSELSVVPENEPLDSDTEAEKNLVERIKSIKQEK